MTTYFRAKQRGRFRYVCTVTRCPWHSHKFVADREEDEKQAYLELAHHNHAAHPGVFPRWNPDARAIESQKGMRRRDTQRPPADWESGEGAPP